MTTTGHPIGGELRERFDALVGTAGDRAGAVGDGLLAVAGLLSSRASVRRALTDAGSAPERREELARQLFGGRVDDLAVDVVAAASRRRWSRPSDLVTAVDELGVEAHLVAAEAAGRLPSVEDEVFRFIQVVRAEPALRSALVARTAPDDAKRRLLHDLLDGKAQPETVRLVEHAVLDRGARSLERELEWVTELAAARGKRRVAVVHVATPLSTQQQQRLQDALSAQAGAPVQLNVVVEPGLVGGIKVEIGDDVVDGSVQSRLEGARRQLAAGR